MKKIRKILLLLLIFIMANCENVLAAGINIQNVDFSQLSGGSGGSSGGSGERPKQSNDYRPSSSSLKKYTCSYYNNISRNRKITTNAYDMDGTSLIPNNFNIPSTIKIAAGTWVGINVSEYKYVSWNFTDFEYKEIKKEYTCYYSSPGSRSTRLVDQKCIVETRSCPDGYVRSTTECALSIRRKTYCNKYETVYTSGTTTTRKVETDYYKIFSRSSCPTVPDYNVTRYTGPTEKIVESNNTTMNEACKQAAIKKDVSSAINYLNHASVNLTYIKPNKASEMNSSRPTIDTFEKVGGENKTKIQDLTVTIPSSGISYATYEIGPKKVCMDTISGNVYYNSDCNSKKLEIPNTTIWEPSISDNLSYWHYFIPLDATTKTPFSINLADKNSEILTKKECEYVMQNYSTYYKDIIQGVTLKNNKIDTIYAYTGDYATGSIDKNYLSKNNSRCIFATAINFGNNIVQKFYGEKTKSGYTSLKGYGMYFRQIDINNPFPNGLTSDSYWYGLYNTTTKKVKARNTEVALSTSFNNLTYKAELSNNAISKVKTFNEKYPYTSWIGQSTVDNTSGINANGTSNFIRRGSTSGIFTKKANTNSFYKLGCGPANKDWSGCS